MRKIAGWTLLLVIGWQWLGFANGKALGAPALPTPLQGKEPTQPVFFASKESFDDFYAAFCAGKSVQNHFPVRFSAMASGSGKQFVVYVDASRIVRVDIQEDAHYTAQPGEYPGDPVFLNAAKSDFAGCMVRHVAKPYAITLRLARSTLRLTALGRQSTVAGAVAVAVGPKTPFGPDNCASCHICGTDGSPLPELKARFCYKRSMR